MKRKTISHSLSQNRRLKAQGATFQAFVDPFILEGCNDEPPSGIIIAKHNRQWCMLYGQHYLSVRTKGGMMFPEDIDPMIVSKALQADAAGPLKIWWDL